MRHLVDPFLIESSRFDGPVLVTGAGGCIGTWVLAILTASNVPVIASDMSDSRARPELLMGKDAAATLRWETLDVTDYAQMRALVERERISAIIHLAGLQVPFCAANPALGARVNVEGTINILQVARELGIKRTVFASSVAALGFPQGGEYKETLYGAYKLANEQTAYVYWADWQVPSVCLRPNVVYGVGRDQGMSSKNTVAIQAAALGVEYEVPFAGSLSWLYAGEAAAAFIACVSEDGTGAHVFDLNGSCETVENGLAMLREVAPNAAVSCTGTPFPFPPDCSDDPLRAHVPDYPSVLPKDGIKATYDAFTALKAEGRLPPIS